MQASAPTSRRRRLASSACLLAVAAVLAMTGSAFAAAPMPDVIDDPPEAFASGPATADEGVEEGAEAAAAQDATDGAATEPEATAVAVPRPSPIVGNARPTGTLPFTGAEQTVPVLLAALLAILGGITARCAAPARR